VRLVWLFAVAACQHGGAPAPPPTCAAAAEHVRGLLVEQSSGQSEYASGVHASFLRRCTADEWSAEMRACVIATRSLRRPRRCKHTLLSAEQRGALDQELATVERAQGPAPQACSDYRELIERLEACPALPAAARAALAQNYRDTTLQWRRTPPDPPSLEAMCRSMVDGLRQAVAPICGW
jgi:hypothetical protein